MSQYLANDLLRYLVCLPLPLPLFQHQIPCSDQELQDIGEKLRILEIDKQTIGWDLLALETATRSADDRVPDSDDEDEVASAGSVSESDNESTSPPSSSSSSSSSTLSSSGSSVVNAA